MSGLSHVSWDPARTHQSVLQSGRYMAMNTHHGGDSWPCTVAKVGSVAVSFFGGKLSEVSVLSGVKPMEKGTWKF